MDLREGHGLPYALRVGPYGTLLVLTWQRDTTGEAKIVAVADELQEVAGAWVAEGAQAPHDLALTPAPLGVTGAGERLLSVLVAETAPSGSQLRKYVLRGAHHTHTEAAETAAAAQEEEEVPAGLAASHAGHGTVLKPTGGAKAKRAEQGAAGQKQQEETAEEEETAAAAGGAAAESEQAPKESAGQGAAHSGELASPALTPHLEQASIAENEGGELERQGEVEGQDDPLEDLAARLEQAEPGGGGAARPYASSSLLGVFIGLGALACVGLVFSRATAWRGTTARGYRRADRAV